YLSIRSILQNDHSKWFKWLPHEGYVDGFAKVVNSWPSVLKLIIWSYGGEPLVPCMWEAPIVERSNEEQMPVILYSHGFGASRFISATIGAELASHGFLFAAIEHRENSACATYYYESQEKLEKKEETWIPHEKMLFGPDHYTIRNAQLHKRMTEFKRLINLIEELNSGTAKNILPSNFDISSLKDRLQTNSIHAMGHSFGGATSLLTMAHDKRLKSGTLLDSWMFPLKDEKLSVEQPLIFVNSQTFHIPTNLAIIEKYLQEPAGSSHDVFTIRNTSHDLQTDIPYIMGSWLNWFMRKLDSVIGTNINNHLILRFYNQHIGP
ncbi:hypothetical protein AAG570_002627, partial [Ranatra chinensis]